MEIINRDKYSKLEEKIGEGIRRTWVMDRCFSVVGMGVTEGMGEMEGGKKFGGEGKKEGYFSREVVGVRVDESGMRVNIVEVSCKTSGIRFLLNQKIKEMEKFFDENFLDNNKKKEKIVFRIK